MMLGFSALSQAHQEKGKPVSFNSYPPVAYINETTQEIDGPVAALVKAVNKKLMRDTTFQFNPLPRMFVELEAHRADAAFNMSYNTERAKKWHYSLPVHVVNYGLFVKKDNPLDYSSRQQLSGLTIATYGPTNMSKKVEKFAKKIPGARVVIENDFEHVFKMLEADRFGKRGVVYVPDVVGFDTIKEFKLQNVRYAGPDIKNLYYVIFVKETVSKEYVDAFNQVLLTFHRDGTMTDIYARYNGSVTANVPAIEDMVVPGH
jgi:polar amino acid transport system substrate-binding protein